MTDSVIASLNTELDAILQKNDIEVEQFLRNYVRRMCVRRFVKWFLVAWAVCCAIYWVPILNWNAAAIGRLALINVVRPFYNWEVWTDARCLIERNEVSDESHTTTDSNFIGSEECFTCENLETIDRQANISFGHLQRNYLWRNHPVIIIDSHPSWHDIHSDVNIIEFIKLSPKLMAAEPCNVASNLLAKSATTVRQIIRQTEQMAPHEKWFFHFRNCQFESVKASRGIIPYHQRPHYLPNHLPPFRSSWILVSHQYEKKSAHERIHEMKQLNVRDSVVVMQLQGEIHGRLEVNALCSEPCVDHTIRLTTGQSLVFAARFWNFYYEPIAVPDGDAVDFAVTFIAEFEWN